MARPRIFGEDTPTMDWIRQQGRLEFGPNQPRLPSTEFVQTDVDAIVHHHRQGNDSLGVREVQMMLQLEMKGYGGVPRESQMDTLFLQHQCLYDCKNQRLRYSSAVSSFTGESVALWHFGVSFLSHETESIGNCEYVDYGRFDEKGRVLWQPVSVESFMQILEFRRRADNLKPMVIRRHHVVKTVQLYEREPLGFITRVKIKKRS
jgi:hypothetical protein